MDYTPCITIDSIKWERVILNIAGKIKNIDENSVSFSLTNGVISLPIKQVQFINEYYLIRLNITTANIDCSYLDDGEWTLMAQDNVTGVSYMPKITDDLFCDDGIEDEYVYCNDKTIKIQRFNKKFVKSGKHYYQSNPTLNAKGGLTLDIFYQHPNKKNAFIKFLKGFVKLFKPLVYWFNKSWFKIIYYSSNMLPHSGKNVLFTSDSRAEIGGNLGLIYDRMCERGLDKQYDINMMFKESLKTRRSFCDKFKMPFLLGRADIILIDDFNPTIQLVKYKEGVKIIQVWHACGAFKTVGFSRLGKPGGPIIKSKSHKLYTHAIASSTHVSKFYAEAFGIDEGKVYPTGVPRTDIFFDNEYKTEVKERMYEAFEQARGKKVILFAPTFRGNGAKSAHYPFGKINMQALGDYCKSSNSVVIFKMHPFVKTPIFIPDEFKDVMIDASEYREINDILFITDLLITDYSSVVYEASSLNIPMLFYAFDLDEYISSRDFYEPFETFVPGKIVKTFGTLMKAIETNDFEQEKVAPFRDKNFEYQDGCSTDRVIDWLILGTKE